LRKKGFTSRKDVKRFIKAGKFKGKKRKKTVYFCDKCECWHFTSKPMEYLINVRRKKYDDNNL